MICLLSLLAANCGETTGAGRSDTDPPSTRTTGGVPSVETPTYGPVPASSCLNSTEQLSPATDLEGVTLARSTDSTRTSLLLKNTGSLSVIVIPDENRTTRLSRAPAHVNPTDPASQAALQAVANSGMIQSVPGLPGGIPWDQVYIVPPQWAVCALTGDVSALASVRYLRDKTSSAEYFLVKELADELSSRFSLAHRRTAATLQTCAEGTFQLLQADPQLQGLDLYTKVLGTTSSCRSSYKTLLGNNEKATQRTGTKVLGLLEKTPRLLETTKFIRAVLS
ncbi:hypothetical protein GCM10009789_60430 [Kribbella sancticallisti]|uniref:Uncharacterized protein n=1 Tax=Kribbella sancticallisti TaxID=460087 RepID=A0ABP4Q5L4_9ACTN